MFNYKFQGQTVKSGSKLVVNWNNALPRGLAYVMLSRAERLEDVYISGNFNPEKIKCVQEALTETERLNEMSLTNQKDDATDNDYTLRFAFINIRSLSKNFEHLERDELMLQNKFIFVTETWIESYHDTDNKNLKDYQCAFANKGRGKGVGVYFEKDGQIEKCEENLYQFIKFQINKITIFCIYLSKGCDFKKVVNSLKNYGFNNNTILIGDLNFDATKNNDLVRYLKSLNLVQMVKRATHLDGHILDHVYVPLKIETLTQIKNHHCYYSDHDGIAICLKKPEVQNEEVLEEMF